MLATRLNVAKKLGQNTAEYVMLLVLVVGGAIMCFQVFGKSIIKNFDNTIARMEGTALGTKKYDINSEQIDKWNVESAGKADFNLEAATTGGTTTGGTTTGGTTTGGTR